MLGGRRACGICRAPRQLRALPPTDSALRSRACIEGELLKHAAAAPGEAPGKGDRLTLSSSRQADERHRHGCPAAPAPKPFRNLGCLWELDCIPQRPAFLHSEARSVAASPLSLTLTKKNKSGPLHPAEAGNPH